MKLNQNKNLTQPQTFESPHQQAILTPPQTSDQPWVDCPDGFDSWKDKLKRPNPPTPEMVERAKFVDKTYVWHGR